MTETLFAARMDDPGSVVQAVLLRIFVGSRDRHDGNPLFEAVVRLAHDAGIAGATVFEGFMGFGANSVVHHSGLFRLSEDLPIVIELVDEESKIRAFLPQLEELLSGGGLITLETLQILRYQPHPKEQA